MKSLIRTVVFFFLCLNVLAKLPKCPLYSDKLEGETCSKLEVNDTTKINTFYIKECEKKDTYCHYFFESKAEQCSSDPPKAYPGEYCNSDKDCFKSKCKEGICKGKGVKEACEEDYECDAGLFCFKRECQHLLSKGDDCDGTKKCKVNLICNKNKCTEYGSLGKGEAASAPAACNSYLIEDEKCQEGYKLETSRDACGNDTKCKYTRGKETLIKDCVCGITTDGKSYCSLGEADVDLRSVLSNNLLVFRLCEQIDRVPYIIWSFLLV